MRNEDKQKYIMSVEQRLQKPQEETGLINLAYTETGISARINHTHYGTFCTCTCLETEHMETPTVNQSFTELSKYLVHANPNLGIKMVCLRATTNQIFKTH